MLFRAHDPLLHGSVGSQPIPSDFFWDWPGIFRSRLWREPVICVLFQYGLRGFHNPVIARKFSKTRLRAEIEERKKAGAWPAGRVRFAKGRRLGRHAGNLHGWFQDLTLIQTLLFGGKIGILSQNLRPERCHICPTTLLPEHRSCRWSKLGGRTTPLAQVRGATNMRLET
jgi:hypothetical protein